MDDYGITGKLAFRNEQHEDFFYWALRKAKNTGREYQALFYCLGLSKRTRDHYDSVYDFEKDKVKDDWLSEYWINEDDIGSIVRMGYDLYLENTPVRYGDGGDMMEKVREFAHYVPDRLFSTSYAFYFIQAIRIRYPDYCSRGYLSDFKDE